MLNKINKGNLILTAFMILSWLGMLIHNRIELPGMPLYRLEFLLPTLISGLLLAIWWIQPEPGALLMGLIFVWSSIHFVLGGILSVIPLPIWPFVPEQSIGHYASHLIYGLAQIPILIFLTSQKRFQMIRKLLDGKFRISR